MNVCWDYMTAAATLSSTRDETPVPANALDPLPSSNPMFSDEGLGTAGGSYNGQESTKMVTLTGLKFIS